MWKMIVLGSLCFFSIISQAAPAPGFVYLNDVDPSIFQDMRYHRDHNFVGRPIDGYESGTCILTKQAADALKKVQGELKKQNLSLMVYDCYRPQRASDDFSAWSKKIGQQQMKREFYPRENKEDFFHLGYVAGRSGHSRGSAVDITIVPLPFKHKSYPDKQSLLDCTASNRYQDGSLDMGTEHDCMDRLSHSLNPKIVGVPRANRLTLRHIMEKYGFDPYSKEWWHFTLKNEPFKNTYFDFPVK